MCTGIRFDDNNGNMYFGRNLDWSTGYGQKVVITPKNYRFRSAFLGDLVMKYPVIGMAIIEENTQGSWCSWARRCPLRIMTRRISGRSAAG